MFRKIGSDSVCSSAGASAEMELVSLVIVANQTGCVCEPPKSTGSTAAAVGGATAVMLAEQAAQQQQRQQQQQRPQ